jgi:hypothetical protein
MRDARQVPGLKICGAHGGGYLPSYLGRTDAQCRRQDDVCTGKKRPVEDYFHTQLMADIMVFREEGCGTWSPNWAWDSWSTAPTCRSAGR